MSRAVLDTSILIATGATLPDDTEFLVTSISYAELQFGLAAVKSADPPEYARRLLRINRVRDIFGRGVPFDDAAASSFGYFTELVIGRGRQVRGRHVDLMIAAIAHSRGAAVITSNVDDFVGLDDALTVIPG